MSFDPVRSAAPQLADPMTTLRTLNRMRRAGFSLRLAGDTLQIAPIDRMNADQRAFIRQNKTALVALLKDAETLWLALQAAGAGGLNWREGTPDDWPDVRLLAAAEALYSDGRMVNRLGRRYATEHAPLSLMEPDSRTDLDMAGQLDISVDIPSEPHPKTAADPAASTDKPPDIAPLTGELLPPEPGKASVLVRNAEQLAMDCRVAELMAEGWEPWNAKAKARSEAEWRNREVSP